LSAKEKPCVEARIQRVKASLGRVESKLCEIRNVAPPVATAPAPKEWKVPRPERAITCIPERFARAAERAAREPRVAVVVPARNEGDEVKATVENLLSIGAQALYLIDDGSKDGSCRPSAMPSQVGVCVNEDPVGVAESRNIGISHAVESMAGVDVICVADAHVRGSENAIRMIADAAHERQAIVSASTCSMKHPDAWTAHGAALLWTGSNFAHAWYRSQEEVLSPITCLYGSVYAIPAPVWKRLGAWIRLREVGGNEQAMSIYSWFAGVPMLCHRDAVFQHRFKRVREYASRVAVINAHLTKYALFEPETYREWFMVRMAGTRKKHKITDEEVTTDPLFISERERVQDVIVRGDEEFFVKVVYEPILNQTIHSGRTSRVLEGY